MNIESKRLNLFPISNDEIRHLIENETIEELQQAYGEMLQGCHDHPEKRMWYAVWFMELKENPGTIVGDFCFKGVGDDGTVEIGYGLREGFCGNGYMTEALLSVSEWALKQDGVKKIIAETTDENEASKKVLQRAGFRFSGNYGEEGPIYYKSTDKFHHVQMDGGHGAKFFVNLQMEINKL